MVFSTAAWLAALAALASRRSRTGIPSSALGSSSTIFMKQGQSIMVWITR